MSKKSPIRRIFRIFLGVILGIVLLLLTTVTVILVTPGARTAVLNKCVKEVNEQTDWDVDLNTNLINTNRLAVRSDHFGAEAELIATTMNLETMRVSDS